MIRRVGLSVLVLCCFFIAGPVLATNPGMENETGGSATPAITRIKTGIRPAAVAFGLGSIWVTNRDDGTLSRVDPASNQVVATIAVGKDPRAVAIGEGSVWVSNWDSGSVSRIDPTTNQLITAIKLDPGTAPYGIVCTKGSVWVAVHNGLVARIDPKRNRVVGKLKLGGHPNHVTRGEGSVWVCNGGDGSVSRIDPKTSQVIATIYLGVKTADSIDGIAAGEGAVWVTVSNFGSVGGRLLRIDPVDNKVVKRIEVDTIVSGVTVSGGFVWAGAPYRRTVLQVDPASNEVISEAAAGEIDSVSQLTVGKGALWVANPAKDNLLRIDNLQVAQTSSEMGEIVINQVDISGFPNVVLYVSVMDTSGELVRGLKAEDFKVAEDEVEQSPIDLATELPAIAAALAMDCSGSMKNAMQDAQRAALSYIENIRTNDEVLLINFADSVKVVHSFTTDKQALLEAVQGTRARGNTALFDAVFEATGTFVEKTGRKVVVVLTDGKDDDGKNRPLSKKKVGDVLNAANEINVPVFSIGLGNNVDEDVLRKISEETGGRYFFSPTAAELEKLYKEIVAQLEGQYRISYTTDLAQEDGSWHRVVVSTQGSVGDKKYKAPHNSAAGN